MVWDYAKGVDQRIQGAAALIAAALKASTKLSIAGTDMSVALLTLAACACV